MKPVHILMLLLLLSACSRPERPNKWIMLSKDSHHTYYYTLDKMTKTEQHLVKIWVKTVFHELRHVGEDDVLYAKNMYMIKCDSKRYKMNVGFFYSATDEAVAKTEPEQDEGEALVLVTPNRETSPKNDSAVPDPYQPITPDSPADRLYGIVCR